MRSRTQIACCAAGGALLGFVIAHFGQRYGMSPQDTLAVTVLATFAIGLMVVGGSS